MWQSKRFLLRRRHFESTRFQNHHKDEDKQKHKKTPTRQKTQMWTKSEKSEEALPLKENILPARGTGVPEGFGGEEGGSFSAGRGNDTFSTKPTQAGSRQCIRETLGKRERHHTWRWRRRRSDLLLSNRRNSGRRRQLWCCWFRFVRRRNLKSKRFQNQQHDNREFS